MRLYRFSVDLSQAWNIFVSFALVDRYGPIIIMRFKIHPLLINEWDLGNGSEPVLVPLIKSKLNCMLTVIRIQNFVFRPIVVMFSYWERT